MSADDPSTVATTRCTADQLHAVLIDEHCCPTARHLTAPLMVPRMSPAGQVLAREPFELPEAGDKAAPSAARVARLSAANLTVSGVRRISSLLAGHATDYLMNLNWVVDALEMLLEPRSTLTPRESGAWSAASPGHPPVPAEAARAVRRSR